MKTTRFFTGALICAGLITAGLTQAQITLDTTVPSPGTGSILVDQGSGVASWADAAGGGGQGPQGEQGEPGPVGSEFWDGDIAGDIYKVNSGNVGIGTTTPTGLLHISGSEPSAIRMSGTRPGYGPRDYLFALQAASLSNGDPGMRLQTVDATAGLIRTILDSQGFFGIGDLTPAARLHVNESPNGAGELGGQLFRITGYEPSMQIEATRNATTWNIGANMSGTADNGMRLMFGNNHMGTAMAINQAGRVGIGQDLPTAKLHVQEMPENSGEQGLLFRLTGREPRMELEAQRNGVIYSIAANMTGEADHGMRLRIGNSDSGTALTINQPGRIGIGTDVPMGGLLHIDGSAGGTLLRLSGSEPAAIKLSGTRPGYGPRDYLFALQAASLNTGDPGMRLQTVDATAGLIRTILDSQGFFGIGDLTPAARLHVNESPNGAGELGGQLFRITGYEPSMQIEATRNATTWNIGANMSGTADNGMRLMIGNNHMGTVMAINQAGRVGIGQDLPVAKLHVQEVPENSGEQGLLFRITGREPTMQIEALRNATTWNIGANFSGTTDNGMRLVIGNNHVGTAMVINQAGRVGIGAENPTAKLEVAGSILIKNGNDGQIRYGNNDGPDRVYMGKAGLDAFFVNDNAGVMKFANGGAERIRILANGNVGVGTTSASHKFTVVGDDAVMIRSGSTGTSGQIRLENSDGSDRSYLGQSTGNVHLFNYSPGYTKLWAAAGASNMTLESSGALSMSSGASCTSGGTWTNASSRDLKDDIMPLALDDALNTLSGLDAVTFRYKVAQDEQCVGFIAEDVPELVATNGRKGLAPMDIVAVLTKVVQQQQQDIEALKAQLQAQP